MERLAVALRRLGRPTRAARLERCGQVIHPCGDRLCPGCGRAWRRRHTAKMMAVIESHPTATILFVVLKTPGAGAESSMARHRAHLSAFLRGAPWTVLGAHHLTRGERGGWLPHTHVLVLGKADARRMSEAIASRWAEVGSSTPPSIEAPRELIACVRYALKGATNVVGGAGSDAGHVAEWCRAMLGPRGGRRAVVVRLARAIHEEDHRFSTPPDALLQERVLVALRSGSMTHSSLVRMFASYERPRARLVLQQMEQGGAIVADLRPNGRVWSLAKPRNA